LPAPPAPKAQQEARLVQAGRPARQGHAFAAAVGGHDDHGGVYRDLGGIPVGVHAPHPVHALSVLFMRLMVGHPAGGKVG